MIQSVEEALKKYKKARLAYLKRSKQLQKTYGHSDFLVYGGDDYSYLVSTNQELTIMAKTLGLTKKKEKKILEELKATISS